VFGTPDERRILWRHMREPVLTACATQKKPMPANSFTSGGSWRTSMETKRIVATMAPATTSSTIQT
jgi:hypothetical protein